MVVVNRNLAKNGIEMKKSPTGGPKYEKVPKEPFEHNTPNSASYKSRTLPVGLKSNDDLVNESQFINVNTKARPTRL